MNTRLAAAWGSPASRGLGAGGSDAAGAAAAALQLLGAAGCQAVALRGGSLDLTDPGDPKKAVALVQLGTTQLGALFPRFFFWGEGPLLK